MTPHLIAARHYLATLERHQFGNASDAELREAWHRLEQSRPTAPKGK